MDIEQKTGEAFAPVDLAHSHSRYLLELDEPSHYAPHVFQRDLFVPGAGGFGRDEVDATATLGRDFHLNEAFVACLHALVRANIFWCARNKVLNHSVVHVVYGVANAKVLLIRRQSECSLLARHVVFNRVSFSCVPMWVFVIR